MRSRAQDMRREGKSGSRLNGGVQQESYRAGSSDGKDRDKKKGRGTARVGKKGMGAEMEKAAAERQKEGELEASPEAPAWAVMLETTEHGKRNSGARWQPGTSCQRLGGG